MKLQVTPEIGVCTGAQLISSFFLAYVRQRRDTTFLSAKLLLSVNETTRRQQLAAVSTEVHFLVPVIVVKKEKEHMIVYSFNAQTDPLNDAAIALDSFFCMHFFLLCLYLCSEKEKHKIY